ncbi:mechanosensitive ion channel family protein [Candidatus Poribacteria bacterium]|nr:mechanosensitive ion channel family protein [Candidatus Poribacteria bacterium]
MEETMWEKYDGFVYGFLSIIVMITLFKLMTKTLRAYTKKHAHKEENAIAFIRYWQYGYIFAATAIIATAFSGEMQTLGITMGFIGSIMAWMLSAPVRNMAGWLFLIVSKPLRVGDRIIVAGYTGDVIDITINFIVLNQVGGTTTGEDKSGRGVLIPTSWLFGQLINNYSMKLPSDQTGQKYLLDEVVVRITYDSDWDEAERILTEAATEVTADAIAETGEKTHIRADFFPSGVFMRVRYKVAPTDRQRVWSEIVKKVTQQIAESDKVFYCFNKANVFVNYRQGEAYPPQLLCEATKLFVNERKVPS